LFIFDRWVDPVLALKEWPEKWLEDLEREAAYRELLNSNSSSSRASAALGAIPQWTRSPATELRASYSLQILRNASFHERNNAAMYRAKLQTFLTRFFELPTEFLVEVAARAPEPFQHVLVIFQGLYDRIHADEATIRVVSKVVPALAMATADAGVLMLVLPLMIRAFANPALPPASEGFLQHMLYFLTLNPPAPLLDYVLDLLAVLATMPQYARVILSDLSFPGYLRSLVLLLEHGARSESAVWTPNAPFRPMEVLNPASDVTIARNAARRRRAERDQDKTRMEMFGGPGVFREVGDTQPVLPVPLKKELWAMSEPKRSISW
jgi:chromatin structure-remodeling complex subunit RSC9